VLKYPVTILLILMTGLQTFSRLWVLLDFEFNKNYIAATLCVNREKPGSCCKGKCYLKKQLRNDQDQQQPVNTGQKDDIPFYQEPADWSFSPPVAAGKIMHPYLCGKSQEYFFSVFEPPQV
jgi:hypothetical protein